MRRALLVLAVVVAVAVPGLVAPPPGGAAPLAGCQLFPADTFWHADVSRLSVHPSSHTWIQRTGAHRGLKMDVGSGLWQGGPIGIPYDVVDGDQPGLPVSFLYDDESDHPPGGYPTAHPPSIEGGAASTGDRHVLTLEQDTCTLYELYDAHPDGSPASSWTAGSGAVWDLSSHEYRGEPGWTSADAAGLPILPALVRHDEAAAGTIDHPLRITVPCTTNAYVWPARHQAGQHDPTCPPMGAWLRLRHTVDLSGFSGPVRNVLEALKVHGAIVADNGSAWYVSGVPDEAWVNDDLHDTQQLTGADLEFVDVSTIRVDGGAASTMRVQDTGQRFIDVPPSSPFFAEVGWLEQQGITTGFVDLTFRPSLRVSRQATVAFLHRLAGAPAGPFPAPGFSDVPGSHPFRAEIAWAADAAVVAGYGDGTFRPGRPVTRQAMAALLQRFVEPGAGPAPDPGFSDVAPGHPFSSEIAWLAASGITTGYGDGTFRPGAAITRQAMAAFLYRADDLP